MLIGPVASCDWQNWRLEGVELAVAAVVEDEARRGPNDAKRRRRESFLDKAIDSRALEVVDFNVGTPEFDDYARLSGGRDMDRGECASIAWCLHDPSARFVTYDARAMVRAVGELGPTQVWHPFDVVLALRAAGLTAQQAIALRDAFWTLTDLHVLHKDTLPARVSSEALRQERGRRH
jgi:hypothetical protein